jgi:hypothetical protein
VEHHDYENPFEEVHRKVKALKDRDRELSKRDAENREILSARKTEELLDKEPD